MTPGDPRHGTDAGYQQHRKDSEPACTPCRRARRNSQSRWRHRGKQCSRYSGRVPGRVSGLGWPL